MPVLKQTSPMVSPSAPNEEPVKTTPFSNINMASFFIFKSFIFYNMGKIDKETLNRWIKAVDSHPRYELHIIKFISKN